MTATAFSHHIKLDDFLGSRIAQADNIQPESLAPGQVLVAVDKVALTSNSLSYVIGSQSGLMPWLDVFPAPEGYGHIPCWGFGDVVHSNNDQVPEGERLYGFFPIASQIVLDAGKTHKGGFTDIAECRAGVAPFYNEYSYVRKEPGYAPEFENNMSLFRPLFATSYLLESFCEDHGFLDDADQVIVSSASSKTAMGFGYLLTKNHAHQVKAIGLTSSRNKDFVSSLGCYDQVISYDELELVDANLRSIVFDVAGNRGVLENIHQRLGDNILYSGQVGQTHWEDKDHRLSKLLPGPRPVYWSGPDQLMALRERYGESGFMKRVQESMIDFMIAAFNWINIEESKGPDASEARVRRMLEGDVNAANGMILMP